MDIFRFVKYKKCRQSVLIKMFANDSSKLSAFEEYVASRCGTFDVSFYSILDELDKFNESELTCNKLYDMVSLLVKKNNINIGKGKISQVAYDLLSCFYRKKYDETNTQRIIRMIKAGYNVRSTELTHIAESV